MTKYIPNEVGTALDMPWRNSRAGNQTCKIGGLIVTVFQRGNRKYGYSIKARDGSEPRFSTKSYATIREAKEAAEAAATS